MVLVDRSIMSLIKFNACSVHGITHAHEPLTSLVRGFAPIIRMALGNASSEKQTTWASFAVSVLRATVGDRELMSVMQNIMLAPEEDDDPYSGYDYNSIAAV